MKSETTLSFLKNLYNRGDETNRGLALKRALLSLAVPVTAGLAMACYGVPMENEFNCSNNVDDDNDGQVDCDDSECSSAEVCRGGCFDGVDNEGDGETDCDDWSCSGSEACLSLTGCSDGDDNDSNGLTDCDDPACSGSADCP